MSSAKSTEHKRSIKDSLSLYWLQFVYHIYLLRFFQAYILISFISILPHLISKQLFNDISEIEHMKSEFPSQPQIFWKAFESGINDVIQFDRPSTFLILHQPASEEVLQQILERLSPHMIEKIGKTFEEPVIVNQEILNSQRFVSDYGEAIESFGDQLRKKHVMIVKNIDKVHGKVAQAFHVLCDEYTPYVNKAIIIFTIQVDDFPENDNLYVEELLTNTWSDLDADILSPLLTRMLGMVLRVNKQRYDKLEVQMFSQIIHNTFFQVSVLIIVTAILYHSIIFHYKDLMELSGEYPEYKTSIIENLSSITFYDHFFVVSPTNDFWLDLEKYLKKKLKINKVQQVSDKTYEYLKKLYEENISDLQDGCIIMFENIVDSHENLLKLYCECKQDMKNLANNSKIICVYQCQKPQWEEKLKKDFMKLIPSKKVICADTSSESCRMTPKYEEKQF